MGFGGLGQRSPGGVLARAGWLGHGPNDCYCDGGPQCGRYYADQLGRYLGQWWAIMNQGYIRQFNPTTDGDWLKANMSIVLSEDLIGFVARDDKKRLGAVLFNDFSFSSAQVHIVIISPKAIKIGLLEFAADYAYNVLNKEYLIAYIAENNTACLNLVSRLGFSLKTTIRDGWEKGVDILMLEAPTEIIDLTLKDRRTVHG
jgi:RimJ/RimL family protein N-acetyltransferase